MALRPTVVTFPGRAKIIDAPEGVTTRQVSGPHGMQTRVVVPPGYRADYELVEQPPRPGASRPEPPRALVRFVKDEPAHAHAELEHGKDEDGGSMVTARSMTYEGVTGTGATAAEAVKALRLAEHAAIANRDLKPQNDAAIPIETAEPEPIEPTEPTRLETRQG